MEAAQTRAEIFLGHPYVRDIVGQSKTTIDFNDIIADRRIVLVRLSTNLSYEAKKIIGTILISELKHAVEHRPSDKRYQFNIYIDEFETFAAYQDFSTLITQAPKYSVSTTLAHHERYGQLLVDPEILGATAAIANKVIFQITVKDAADLAPEFARQPPTETRLEEQYIISQNPVYDLLHGHHNPVVRRDVDRYIRPLRDRLEDIAGEAEGERLIRTDYLDDANLSRIDERIQGVDSLNADYRALRRSLGQSGRALLRAGEQTDKLRYLNFESAGLRVSLREMNRFLTGIMEGRLYPGTDEFSGFLARCVQGMFPAGDVDGRVLTSYIALVYGDPKTEKIVPYRVAKQRFSQYVDGQENLYEAGIIIAETLAGCMQKSEQKELNRTCRLENRKPTKAEINEAYGEREPPDLYPDVVSTSENRNLQQVIASWSVAVSSLINQLKDFVNFCVLLGRPENHIRTRSGQFIEKQVPTRTVADMVNEMTGELTELPKYTAYAKVLQGNTVRKEKIRTRELPELQTIWSHDSKTGKIHLVPSGRFLLKGTKTATINTYCKACTEIEEEIRKRQEGWKPILKPPFIFPQDMIIEWPPGVKKPKLPDEPPPTSY